MFHELFKLSKSYIHVYFEVAKLAYILNECPGFQCLAGSASFSAPAMCFGAVGGACATNFNYDEHGQARANQRRHGFATEYTMRVKNWIPKFCQIYHFLDTVS